MLFMIVKNVNIANVSSSNLSFAPKKNSFHSKQKQNNRNSTNGTCPFKKNDTYTVIRFKFMQNNMQTNRIDARSGLCSIVLRIFM